jgi:hypothetical protein
MPDFEQAWAVVVRDSGTLDGDQLDVVEVLRVLWNPEDALAEVDRLRQSDPSNDRFYYYEETEVERRLK